MRGDRWIAAAALGVALPSSLALVQVPFASGGSGATTALVRLEVGPRGPGSVSTSTAGGVDLDNGSAPISGACEDNHDTQLCRWAFQRGTAVTLVPHASGSGFAGWSTPDCPGTGSCTVKLDDDVTSVVALFSPLTLGVRMSNHANGTVTSVPAGINCTTDFGDGCEHDFPANTRVQLTVTGGDFKDWNGPCTPAGSRTCTIVVNNQTTWAGARFGSDDSPELAGTINVTFRLQKTGNGGGTVTAKGINCGSSCSVSARYGDTLTLSATPDGNSTFGGWGGVCASIQQTCSLAAGPITKIKAVFEHDTAAPGAPPGLKLTGATLTSASIAWGASTDNVGVTGYRVYNGDATAGDVTATEFTVTGLACSRTYTIGVDATDAAGNRSQKSTITAATKLCPLASRLAGVAVRRAGAARTIEIQLRVNRATTAVMTLTAGTRKVAGARFKVRPGTNVLRLPVAAAASAGRYRLNVTVVDPDGGKTQAFSHGVLLPRSR